MRWTGKKIIQLVLDCECEAANWFDAEVAFREQARVRAEQVRTTCGPFAHTSTMSHNDTHVQHGEPWLERCAWYDLHGPGDVYLCERACGHTFTQADVELLVGRVQLVLGVQVVDRWNGAGCNTVSFRCTGRVGTDQVTAEQRAQIGAPRP